jgi:hypothetical protein
MENNLDYIFRVFCYFRVFRVPHALLDMKLRTDIGFDSLLFIWPAEAERYEYL